MQVDTTKSRHGTSVKASWLEGPWTSYTQPTLLPWQTRGTRVEDYVLIQALYAMRFVFNDAVDRSTFNWKSQGGRKRSLSIRYMDNLQGLNLGPEVIARHSFSRDWTESTTDSITQLEPGTYLWENDQTLLLAPPVDKWMPGKFVRFEFDRAITGVAGNPMCTDHRPVIVARVAEDLPEPTPAFQLTVKLKKTGISVDDRSAELELLLRATGIDSRTHFLDDVRLYIDAVGIPANVSLNGIRQSANEAWHEIGHVAQMRGDGDSKVFRPVVRTGFFSSLDARLTSTGGPIKIDSKILRSWPSASPGQIKLNAKVRCVVRQLGGPNPMFYSTTPVEFAVKCD